MPPVTTLMRRIASIGRTTVDSPPPMVARSVNPRIASPFGVKSASVRMSGGDDEMTMKLPPSSASPKTSNEENPSAWRWVRATPITRAVRQTTEQTRASPSNTAASGLPQFAPKATDVMTPTVARLSAP